MADSSPMQVSDARVLLTGYLNKRMRVVVSDGRVIDGNFLCTDRDRNIVLGNCEEFFSREEVAAVEEVGPRSKSRQPRTLGLAIIPGEHINSIAIAKELELPQSLIKTSNAITHVTSYPDQEAVSYPDQEAASYPDHEPHTTTSSSSSTGVSEN